MNRFTEDEMKRLWELKAMTVDKCDKCDEGFRDDGSVVSMCECMKVFRFIKELIYAEIPEDYWLLDFSKLPIHPSAARLLVSKYLRNLERASTQGKGVCMLGPNGVGKTSALVEIGKRAITLDISIVYVVAQDYINYKMQNDLDAVERVESASMVLLDELDKPYKKKGSDYVVAQIENLLRSLIPRNRVVCCASNWKVEELQDYFGDSVYSVMQRKLKFLTILGDDKSSGLQDEWENGLDGDVDYMKPHLLALAEQREVWKSKHSETQQPS